MDELNIVITAIGGIVLLLGLVSDYFRRNWWTSDPLTALLLGVALGPIALSWIDPIQWGLSKELILEQTTRVTLTIGLMGVALRLPQQFMVQHWRSLAVLLGLVMPLMWLVSGLLVYGLLELPFWIAMMIGAAITPTDPIVATSIVSGSLADNHLPARLRHIISAESGSNDGLAYPLVLLCIFMLEQPTAAVSWSGLLLYWFWRVMVIEVGGSIVFGAIAGYVAGQLLKLAERHKTIENTSFITYSLALSVTVLGAAKLLGTDGILAVFVAGLAFGHQVVGQERSQEENVQEAINRFFTLPFFLLLGLMIPWQQWLELGWRGIGLAITILLLRRLPAVLLLHRQMPSLHNLPETLFTGWFGPVGVAAIFYAGLCLRRTGLEEVWTICSLMVCASIVVQGLSASPLTRLCGRYVETASPDKHPTD